MALSPDMVAARGALTLVNAIHNMGEGSEEERFVKSLIVSVVKDVGPMQTIIGFSNLVKMLLMLREQEVGYPTAVTLQALSMSIARLETEDGTDS